MKLFAKVYALEPIEEGVGENGAWKRRTMVIETLENEPKLIALDCFGEKRLQSMEELEQGQLVEVVCGIEARQHDGRWYNRVNLQTVKGYSAIV